MAVGLLRGLPEVTGLVTVCSLDCWELPSANQHSFKHFTVFPDLLPTDVLCLGRVASDLGKEAGAAELRQGERGASFSCFVICPFVEEWGRASKMSTLARGGRKRAELLSTDGGRISS